MGAEVEAHHSESSISIMDKGRDESRPSDVSADEAQGEAHEEAPGEGQQQERIETSADSDNAV